MPVPFLRRSRPRALLLTVTAVVAVVAPLAGCGGGSGGSDGGRPAADAQTVNAYLAFRAVLLAVRAHNASDHETKIGSVLCPGLGTGIGALDPTRRAVQMRLAYQQVRAPARIPSTTR